MKVSKIIYRICKNKKCKRRFKIKESPQKYCCDECKNKYYQVKHKKNPKFKVLCCIKDCKNKSSGFLNNNHYCKIHYQIEKKKNDLVLRTEKNQIKFKRKKRDVWICDKCGNVIPFVKGRPRRLCINCKEKIKKDKIKKNLECFSFTPKQLDKILNEISEKEVLT